MAINLNLEKAPAYQFAEMGMKLILTARRIDRLTLIPDVIDFILWL